jgi:glycosyltransferase involved in cell wall biosynthesis
VHDYLVVRGGAERALLSLAKVYPDAPIYTAIHRPETTLPEFADLPVRALWTTNIPVTAATYRPWVVAYALAFEALSLRGFDLVISLSSGFAKSAGSAARARLSWCMTPPRFVWPTGVSAAGSGMVETAGQVVLRPFLRWMDLRAARRVHLFAANSENVRTRIRRFYGREAEVLYPPIDVDRLRPLPGARRGESYLLVGRLVRYKCFDEVIRAFRGSRRRLIVVGSGPDRLRLESLAGPEVTFAGEVSDSELVRLYSSVRGLIVPGEEDWGMTGLEANSCGCPVVGAARGGARESVVDGVTGVLYHPDGANGLEGALGRLESCELSTTRIRRHALRFRQERFRDELARLTSRALSAAGGSRYDASSG